MISGAPHMELTEDLKRRVMTRAHDLYAVYMASCDGRSWDNKPCPKWAKLNDAVRGHWFVVALRSMQLQLVDPAADLLGHEASILPSADVIGHLGDDARVEGALMTWTEYSR